MTDLQSLFEAAALPFSPLIEANFDRYFALLCQWNERFNLTAITQRSEVDLKHFYDSAYPARLFAQNASLIDIGSGAGFPAIPLSIVRPDLHITMVDSLNKRVTFLNAVIDALGLVNCRAVYARAEELLRTDSTRYDYAVARAVAPLSTLLEYLIPYIKVGGSAIVYKSQNADEELETSKHAMQVLSADLRFREDYDLPVCAHKRVILQFVKLKPTPTLYPRTGNKPKNQPLC